MVFFIGAGSGDPELITIKGKKLIDSADVIIYAGSLVNEEVLNGRKEGAKVYNSANMSLEDVVEVVKEAHSKGQNVARVHTGDPSIYGAHREQMIEFAKLGIEYEIVPGVSSFLAAAASLKREYTLPGVTQTVIITRMEGRTKVPELESIERLSTHNATMAIFLSVGMIEELQKKLATSYPLTTPVAVVYKASWEDEEIIISDLEHIAGKVIEKGITKTALVLVGEFLNDKFDYSKLYDKKFTHEYREGI
nr:MAG: precorrin-4 C(11)-methyltransferase [Clostridiales bacterium]